MAIDEVERLTIAYNGDLYAGMYNSGIYKSTDDGATWILNNNGLPANAQVTALCGIIRGTSITAIGVMNLFLLCLVYLEGVFILQPNYDFMGKVVDVVSNRIYSKGKHTIGWGTDGLAPGVYCLRMQAGNSTISRMLVVGE